MIPIWAIAGVASLASGFLAGTYLSTKIWDAKLQSERASRAQERAAAAEVLVSVSEGYRKQEAQREANKTASIEEAHAQIDKLQVALKRSDAVSVGLRSKFASYLQSARATESASTEPRSQTAVTASELPAKLFGELDELAGSYAKTADERRIAGLACEREHP